MVIIPCHFFLAVLSDGTLYGVAGIDVVVNSSDISNAIRNRRVDANVPGDPLACQMQQVSQVSISNLVSILCNNHPSS